MAKESEKTNDLVVGVDLGGTKILAAVVAADGKILGQAKRKTKPEDVYKRQEVLSEGWAVA